MIYVGGAKGFDCFVMQMAFALGVPYTVHSPFPGFVPDNYDVEGTLYGDLLENAAEVTYEAEKYTGNHLYMQRNMRIVDASDKMYAYWDGTPSGTKNTVHYAENQGKEIVNIYKED